MAGLSYVEFLQFRVTRSLVYAPVILALLLVAIAWGIRAVNKLKYGSERPSPVVKAIVVVVFLILGVSLLMHS